MGINLLRASRAALPSSGLNIASRAAMAWLADAARDDTALTWLAQATLADLVGCAPNYMGKVIAALQAAGMVSTWRRSGRVPLYFVHPIGVAALPAISAKAVRCHLRDGKFSIDDIGEVIAWLGSLGVMAAASVTPKLSLGVSDARPPPPNSVRGDPQTQFAPTPQLSLAEPKENPNITQKASVRLASIETGCDDRRQHIDAAKAVSAVVDQQTSKPTSKRAAWRDECESWRGAPMDVLAAKIAVAGPEGVRLAGMVPADALAAVERQQRLLRLVPGAPPEGAIGKAAP